MQNFINGNNMNVRGDFEGAADQYRECVSILGDVSCYYNLGQMLLKVGRLNASRNAFEECARRHPKESICLEGVGIAYLAQSKTSSAASAFQECLGIDPHNLSCTNGLGIARRKGGDLDQAESLFRQCSIAAPQKDEYLSNLGEVLIAKSEDEKAIAPLLSCINANSNSHLCLSMLGQVYQHTLKYGPAIRYYNRAAALSPLNVDYHFKLASTLKSNRQLKEASEEFTRCIQLQPNNPIFLEMSGRTHLELGELDAALPLFEQCIQINSTNAETCHRYLGDSYMKKADYENAIHNFKRVISLNPMRFHAYYQVAYASTQQFKILCQDKYQSIVEKIQNL